MCYTASYIETTSYTSRVYKWIYINEGLPRPRADCRGVKGDANTYVDHGVHSAHVIHGLRISVLSRSEREKKKKKLREIVALLYPYRRKSLKYSLIELKIKLILLKHKISCESVLWKIKHKNDNDEIDVTQDFQLLSRCIG